jgi:hypothetical protein
VTLQIDPRHRPLRGVVAISEYLGSQQNELTRRQIRRGMLDVSYDGATIVSSPARLDASPLITGAAPLEKPAKQPTRRGRFSRGRRAKAEVVR